MSPKKRCIKYHETFVTTSILLYITQSTSVKPWMFALCHTDTSIHDGVLDSVKCSIFNELWAGQWASCPTCICLPCRDLQADWNSRVRSLQVMILETTVRCTGNSQKSKVNTSTVVYCDLKTELLNRQRVTRNLVEMSAPEQSPASSVGEKKGSWLISVWYVKAHILLR